MVGRARARGGVIGPGGELGRGMRGGGARAGSQTRKLPLSMSQVALRLISAEPTADSHPQNFGVPVDRAPPPLYHPPTHPKSRPPSEGRPSTARGWACSSGNVLGVGVLERRARGYQLGVCVNRFPFRIAPKLLRWDCGACTKEHLNLRDYRHTPRSDRERAEREFALRQGKPVSVASLEELNPKGKDDPARSLKE